MTPLHGDRAGLRDRDAPDESALREAEELLVAERFGAALTRFKQLGPSSARALSGQAAAYAGLAEFDQAAGAVRQALERDPAEARALAVAGYLADVHDRAPQRAAALLRRAVEADAHSAYANYRLGVFLLKYEHYDEARAALQEALALQPANWRAALALSRFALTRQQRARDALAARRAGLAANPTDLRLWVGLLWAIVKSPTALLGGQVGPPSTETARRQHLALQALFSQPARPVFTYTVLAINTLLFVILEATSGWQDPDVATLIRFGALDGPAIAHGEWWRLLTPMVLHASLIHWAMNSLFLWVMGPLVERVFGWRRMAFLYVFAGVCGSLASYLHNPQGLSVGASGALFGLLGALAVFFWRTRGLLGSFGGRQFTGIVATAVLNLVFDQVVPVIDTAAHIGGLIGGVLAGLLLMPRYALDETVPPTLHDRRSRASLVISAIVLTVALMIVIQFTVYR